MASIIINEEKFIQDNLFKYEERLNSKLSRFLDRPPVFVTYYHIDNLESTTDEDFMDIEHLISKKSPLRFQKIVNFPLYDFDPIALQLSEEDQGIDSSYEADCQILPKTIIPVPNSMFTINHASEKLVFRVKEIFYDNMRADGYYKISFKLEYYDDVKLQQLENQVSNNYSCILENVGTEEKCIIREDYIDKLIKINNLYDDITTMYKALFYSKRYNSFIGHTVDDYELYDPLMTEFINKHKLFNDKNDFNTILLTHHNTDVLRPQKYEKSFYRFIERRDITLIENFFYQKIPATNYQQSSFKQWHDTRVQYAEVPVIACRCMPCIISDEFMDSVLNNKQDIQNIYGKLIKKYVCREIINPLDEIDLNLYKELISMKANEALYFFTPVILYIIKDLVDTFLKTV